MRVSKVEKICRAGALTWTPEILSNIIQSHGGGELLTSNCASLPVEVLSMKCIAWASQTWLHVIIARGIFEKNLSTQAVSTSHLIQDLWRGDPNIRLWGSSPGDSNVQSNIRTSHPQSSSFPSVVPIPSVSIRSSNSITPHLLSGELWGRGPGICVLSCSQGDDDACLKFASL